VLGTEVILGAFLAGVIVSLLRTPDDTDLTHQLDCHGLVFSFRSFLSWLACASTWRPLLTSTQAMVLVPVLRVPPSSSTIAIACSAAGVWMARSVVRRRVAFAPSRSIIAASAIGMRLGVISESVTPSIILIAIITVLLRR